MSTILSLPPELLLEIFSQAVQPKCFASYPEFLDKTKMLLSLALVHSTWTGTAQTLLGETVRIDGSRKNRAKVRRRLQLLKGNPPRLRPKALQLVDVSAKVQSEIEGNVWDGLKLLRDFWGESFWGESSGNVSRYARFPALEVLDVRCSGLDLSAPRDTPPFHHLRRLAVDCEVVLSPTTATSNIVSPTYMPKLIHLAIEGNEMHPETFDAVLPQLKTLALADIASFKLSSSLLHDTSLLGSLEHLSLEFNTRPIPATLFSMLAGLELESLHLEATAFRNMVVRARLVAVANGNKEVFKSKRIVFYGDRREVERSGEDNTDLDAFEWRENIPPFVDFDGNS